MGEAEAAGERERRELLPMEARPGMKAGSYFCLGLNIPQIHIPPASSFPCQGVQARWPGCPPAPWATRETRNATASSCPASLPGHPQAGHRPLGDTISQRVGLGEGQPEAAAGQARTRTQTLTPWQLPCPSGCRSRAWWVPCGQPRSKTKQHPVEHTGLPCRGSQPALPKPKSPRCVPTLRELTGTWGTAARPLDPTAPPITAPRTPHCTREDTDTSGAPGPCQAPAGRSAQDSQGQPHSPRPPRPQAPESREGANTS